MERIGIAFSGVISSAQRTALGQEATIHCIPRQGTTLYVGAQCADGRPITESWKYKRALRLGIPIVVLGDPVGEKTKKTSLVEKYRPQRMDDIIGHKAEIKELTAWLAGWSNGTVRGPRGALLTGPPGIGKTTLVHLLAKEAGYAVTEYNASDTRSVTALRGQFALGVKRLRREVIVMDEVDGLCERGGVGELAAILRSTTTPIFCIANDRGPKLKPLLSVSLDIRLRRPMAGTISTALGRIAVAENIPVSRGELETMCEKSGNDIRAMLHQLEFYTGGGSLGQKDALQRLDAFSATQRLFSSKRLPWESAEDLVYVDYHMVPLMVQEAYVHAGRDDMDTIASSADILSQGDLLQRMVHRGQDWSVLPHVVGGAVSVTKAVAGNAPFQLFPQMLGKMSKQRKQVRWMEDLTRRVHPGLRPHTMRLDEADTLYRIIASRLQGDKPDIKGLIQEMDTIGLTREDVLDTLDAVVFDGLPISTKAKTAFTREWKKGHESCGIKLKRGTGRTDVDTMEDTGDIEEGAEAEGDIEEGAEAEGDIEEAEEAGAEMGFR